MDPNAMPPGAPPDWGPRHRSHRQRRSDANTSTPIVPIFIAVLCAMVAIPAISLRTFGMIGPQKGVARSPDRTLNPASPGGGRGLDEIGASEIRLTELPRLTMDSEADQVEQLRTWLRGHFSDAEVANLRNGFVADRPASRVIPDIQRITGEVLRGNFTNVPRDIADAVKEKLGEGTVETLKAVIPRLDVPPQRAERMSVEEVYTAPRD